MDGVRVLFEDVSEDEATVIGSYTITNTIQPRGREVALVVFDTTNLEESRTIRVTADPGRRNH